MAMLVVSIAAVTAVALTQEQLFSIKRTANLSSYNTALMYGVGLEDFARVILQKDASDSKIDHIDEDWAIGVPVLPIEGGFLSGAIMDAQSLININSVLSSAQTSKNLLELCNNLGVNPDFIPALKDWLDKDLDTGFPDGAEDDYYTALETPYRSANRLMVDVTELRLVKGIDDEIYNKLISFIIVLPEETPINLNTIESEQVLSALKIENLDYQNFIEKREENAFSSLQDFQNKMNLTLDDQQKTNLAVKSNYFQASGQIALGDKNIIINSLIHRDDKGKTHIISRSLGDIF